MGESSKVPYNICDDSISFNEIIEDSRCEKQKNSKESSADEKTNFGKSDSLFCENNQTLHQSLAICISWISIIATLAICIIEFVVSSRENSTAAFGLAFSAILDLLSSVVVLWRFYNFNQQAPTQRENISCVVLGFLFICSSITISVKAAFNLHQHFLSTSMQGFNLLLITSLVSAVICFILVIFKLVLAKLLSSCTLFTDALNSAAAAVIAISIVVNTEVLKIYPDLWFLDPTIGLIVSLLIFLYGCWLLVKNVAEIRKK